MSNFLLIIFFQLCSDNTLNHEEDEDEMFTASVGAVHQAVLDNNLAKLEKLIEVLLFIDECHVMQCLFRMTIHWMKGIPTH